MNHRLNPSQQAQLMAQYQNGMSTRELARLFEINRHTVAKHLRRGGVVVRPQLKMTPHRVQQATRLYADGQSLATIGEHLGVDASTIHKALKRAGVNMRDTHGRDR
jgi:DNA-directed RNA polymerase specialized sigma24 family protein